MGSIHVHEFMSLDGVIERPDVDVRLRLPAGDGEGRRRGHGSVPGILLGRTTYEMFEPAWSTRTAEEDPGAPFFPDTMKYVVSGTLRAYLEELPDHRRV